jgi:diguanylate cyclase (GGDEF)-like protein
MIDVDKFKVINDRYGHQAGDYVLKALAKLMMQLNRNTDHLFRYGGEEFVVILNHTLAQGALFVGERMREQIEQNDFIYQGVKIPVTISIGISIFQKQDSAKELFTRADTALYTAKKSGRNQVFCLERSSN